MGPTVYHIIRRPIITEKGLGVKETQHTVVFEVAAAATKTQIKEAVQKIFKVKVADVRTANFHGKFRRRGRAEGYQLDVSLFPVTPVPFAGTLRQVSPPRSRRRVPA